MRWPSFSSLKSSSTGMPGYGEPPSVKISQSRTPKDQLWAAGARHRQPTLPPAVPRACGSHRTGPSGAQGATDGARLCPTAPRPLPWCGLCPARLPTPPPPGSGGHVHVTLVGVDAVKQGLGRHPLHGQAALGGGTGFADRQALSRLESPTLPRPGSHWWSSCSSRGCARRGPGQSPRSSSRCPRSPAHCGRPGPCGCTGHRTAVEAVATGCSLRPPPGPAPPALTFCEARYSMPRATW